MIIKREVNGIEMEFELTSKEISKAHDEHVTNWMRDTLINDFDLDEETAKEYAVVAYDKYCCGNGETEYECVESAYEVYEQDLEERGQ